MNKELEVLVAAAPHHRDSLADVYPPAERRELFERITALAADEVSETAVPLQRTWIQLVHQPTGSCRRPQRALISMIAAVVAAACVVAAYIVVARWGSGQGADPASQLTVPSATPEKLRPVWQFTVDPVPGYVIARDDILREGDINHLEQGALVTSTTQPKFWGALTVLSESFPYRDGQPDGERVDVNGQPGIFEAGKHVTGANLEPTVYARPWQAAEESSDDQPVLSWRHPDGSWARLVGTFGFDPVTYDYDNEAALADMLRIARAVHLGVNDDVSMPFRLERLPSGLVPENVSIWDGAPCLGYGNGTGPYPGEWVGSIMTVCRAPTAESHAATLEPTRINESESDSVTFRDLPDGTTLIVEVDQGQGDVVTADLARQVADDANASPTLGDPRTWLPVT